MAIYPGNIVRQHLHNVKHTEQLLQVEQVVHEDPRLLVGQPFH
jgi:hypothetical protein